LTFWTSLLTIYPLPNSDHKRYLEKNSGYNYLLTVIDCFSKYTWDKPIKNKSADEIIKSFDEIFEERKPVKLLTDKGKEFKNKNFQSFLKEHNVVWFSTDSEFKSSIVERFNRTLKTKMWKYFTQVGNRKWINILDDLISNYNNTYHTHSFIVNCFCILYLSPTLIFKISLSINSSFI
jgi:transposase InsO family protein